MANELNFAKTPGGLTVVAAIHDAAWVQQGGDVTMTETAAGLYVGSVPIVSPQIPYGKYAVVFYDGGVSPRAIIGIGELLWDGSAEIALTRDELPFIDVS